MKIFINIQLSFKQYTYTILDLYIKSTPEMNIYEHLLYFKRNTKVDQDIIFKIFD